MCLTLTTCHLPALQTLLTLPNLLKPATANLTALTLGLLLPLLPSLLTAPVVPGLSPHCYHCTAEPKGQEHKGGMPGSTRA